MATDLTRIADDPQSGPSSRNARAARNGLTSVAESMRETHQIALNGVLAPQRTTPDAWRRANSSLLVTDDFGNWSKSVAINRNGRSRLDEMGGHDEPKYALTLSRWE